MVSANVRTCFVLFPDVTQLDLMGPAEVFWPMPGGRNRTRCSTASAISF
jgi:hypothetical protein